MLRSVPFMWTESLLTEAELSPSAAHAGDTRLSNAKRTTARAVPLTGNPNSEKREFIKILFPGPDKGFFGCRWVAEFCPSGNQPLTSYIWPGTYRVNAFCVHMFCALRVWAGGWRAFPICWEMWELRCFLIK